MKSFASYVTEASEVSVKHADVLKALTSIEKKIVDRPLTPQAIKKLFTKPLNSIVPCTVSIDKSDAVSPNTLNVTAFFDQDVDEDDWEWDEYQFEFILVFNPSDKEVMVGPKFWKWFKAELADAIVHEMLHRSQARSRNYAVNGNAYLKSKDKEQQYYGRPDEIEAFALNAALELKRNFKTVAAAMKALSTFSRINRTAPSIKRYVDTFQSPSHPVMKTFMKKVYFFLKNEI